MDLLKKLPPKGVLNFSDLFEEEMTFEGQINFTDKAFKISYTFTPIIFLSLVYAGYAVLTLKNGSTLTAFESGSGAEDQRDRLI